jgi:hypothetical protein
LAKWSSDEDQVERQGWRARRRDQDRRAETRLTRRSRLEVEAMKIKTNIKAGIVSPRDPQSGLA